METTCHRCAKTFDVKPYRLDRNKSGVMFCSVECRKLDGSTLGLSPRQTEPIECPICGSMFHRKACERRAVNYCSYACAAKGTRNLQAPPKGQRRSVATEFHEGHAPANRMPVGSVTIRARVRRGDSRAWVKVAEPNVWRPRAVVAWELVNGPIPRGHVIHHENRDPLDDRIENLRALSRSEHLHEHRSDFKSP